MRYFISREFLLTLLALVGLGIGVYLLIFFFFLPFYTRHGEGQLVPDVTEMTQVEAMKALENEGLRPELADSVYRSDLPPGSVVKQYPSPFSRVKPNRSIALTINQRKPPMVKVPEVVDMSLYQAKLRLESYKLGIGRVTYKPDISSNVILEATYEGQPISSGLEVTQGSKIDVVVSNQKSSVYQVQVPDLEGYTYDDALTLITELGLNLGSVLYNLDGPEDMMGRVYSQTPKPGFGDSIRVGYPIDLYVYGEEPEASEGIEFEVEDGGE
jgi:eukaryotic-like serine/threonine-protein kinase